ncbi:hypothetical protein CRG98_047860 [Punica granatum]|uniref:Geraniol 8-hydroxylase-like n=1 Tax=Punica granatum TaxID=22663 RepID=A0A2I0HJ73_PUNGR|nr:hypothetical protein CRG98_047860 [Punica granatum]
MDLLLLILGLYYLSWGLLRALLYLANRGKPSMVGVLSQSKATPGDWEPPRAQGSTPELGCITTVVVTSAPLTGEILQTFDTLFSNRLVPDTITALRRDEFGQSWMSISLLWKNLRQICNAHLFTHKILESNQHLRRHQVQHHVLHRPGGPYLRDNRKFKAAVWRIMVEMGTSNIADYFPVLKKIDPRPQGAKRSMTDGISHMFEVFDRDLLVAGTEATTSILEWAMSEMLHSPKMLVKAQAELEQAMVKEIIDLSDASGSPSGSLHGQSQRAGIELPFELLPFGWRAENFPWPAFAHLASRMIHLMLSSLLNGFHWKLEDGSSPETMDMGDNYGITLQRAQSLWAVPLPVEK